MARWQLFTAPDSMNRNAKLTGRFSDSDRRWRFGILRAQLMTAEADLAKRRKEWDDELAAARRQGQDEIAAEFVADLAERLGR